MAVKIVKAVLAQQVQDGWKKDKLAEHYGLSMVQMGEALKQAGLKIRKFHAPKFELVDEEVSEETEVSDTASEVMEVSQSVVEEVKEASW